MRFRDLSPFIGRHCQLMVDCDACGGTHVHEGTLALARQPGEVQLGGRSYPVHQIRALVDVPATEAAAEGITISMRAFQMLWQAGLLLAMLAAARAVWR